MTGPRVIELVEYRPLRLPADGFENSAAAVLLRDCKAQFSIEYPTPKTNGEWEIKPEGIVGYVPLTDEIHLRILPKAPVGNLLRMMEAAYDSRIEFARRAVAESDSLDDLFDSLARLLLDRVERRLRIGLYRDYRTDTDAPPTSRSTTATASPGGSAGRAAPVAMSSTWPSTSAWPQTRPGR